MLSLACSPSSEEGGDLSQREIDLMKIDSVENQIREAISSSINPDIKLALQAIKRYDLFAYKYPKDSLTPGYLFKSAQMQDGVLGDKSAAIKTYGKIYEEFPEYKKRPMMLFYQANALHDVGDTTSAINRLELFIARYPDHDFADDAENLITFIRMDESKMEEFLKGK
jgi:outer membrane protein assembly factor BamD (BamD/ComL family)